MVGDDQTEDVVEQLRAARAAIVARLSTLDRVTAVAAGRVYCQESAGQAVVASVDGNGRLLDLAIQPAAWRQPHPERVGPEIVHAVGGARGGAAREKAHQLRSALAAGR